MLRGQDTYFQVNNTQATTSPRPVFHGDGRRLVTAGIATWRREGRSRRAARPLSPRGRPARLAPGAVDGLTGGTMPAGRDAACGRLIELAAAASEETCHHAVDPSSVHPWVGVVARCSRPVRWLFGSASRPIPMAGGAGAVVPAPLAPLRGSRRVVRGRDQFDTLTDTLSERTRMRDLRGHHWIRNSLTCRPQQNDDPDTSGRSWTVPNVITLQRRGRHRLHRRGVARSHGQSPSTARSCPARRPRSWSNPAQRPLRCGRRR